MLCDSCKNKNICKHYEYFNNILLDISIQVNSCEMYSNKIQSSTPIYNPDKRPIYRQPLPSTIEEEVEDNMEEEEKIIIDLNTCDNEPHSATIVDLFMKGDHEDGKENR
jgi:hypothetical protein